MESLELQAIFEKHCAVVTINFYFELNKSPADIKLFKMIEGISELENVKPNGVIFREIVRYIMNSSQLAHIDNESVPMRYKQHKIFIIDPLNLTLQNIHIKPAPPPANHLLSYIQDVAPAYDCFKLTDYRVVETIRKYGNEFLFPLFSNEDGDQIKDEFDSVFTTWRKARDEDDSDLMSILEKTVLDPMNFILSHITDDLKLTYKREDYVQFNTPPDFPTLQRLNKMELNAHNVIYVSSKEERLFPIYITDQDVLESAKFLNGEDYTPQDIKMWKSFIAHILSSKRVGGMITNGKHTIVLISRYNPELDYDNSSKCLLAQFKYRLVDHSDTECKVTLQMMYMMLVMYYEHDGHLLLLEDLLNKPKTMQLY